MKTVNRGTISGEPRIILRKKARVRRWWFEKSPQVKIIFFFVVILGGWAKYQKSQMSVEQQIYLTHFDKQNFDPFKKY